MTGTQLQRRSLALAMILLAAACSGLAAPVGAQTESAVAARNSWQLATGLGAGAVSPDQSLADYRWDTRPAELASLQAVAQRGRLGLGLRFSRWTTTQGTGLAVPVTDPKVRLNALDVVALGRVVAAAHWQIWGLAAVGRTNISYTPDRVVIPGGLPGEDIAVGFDSQHELNLGLGFFVQRSLSRSLKAALQSEWSSFQLDASHRRGSEIVSERQRFINWSLRLQISWVMALG